MRFHIVTASAVLACVMACGAGGETADVDGGRTAPILSENPELDSGPEGPDECALLVQRTCGPSSTECGESASCAAALLLQRYEVDRCGAALASPETYEECTDDACTKLMEKTCGDAPEPIGDCVTDPGCALTRNLYDASRDDDASPDDRSEARDACAAGLEDGIVFPACDG